MQLKEHTTVNIGQNNQKTKRLLSYTHLIPVIVHLHPAVGVYRQIVSKVVLAVVRGLHASTEEQNSLWTGVRPRQDALLVHTTQHLRTHKMLNVK